MLNRLDLRGRGRPAIEDLPRPVVAGDGPRAVVRDLIAQVRQEGDRALLELTTRFDGVDLTSLQVPEAVLDQAVAEIDPALRTAFEVAIDGYRQHHLFEQKVVLDRLPEGMRQVLILHDVEGYTHEEIGEVLGVTSGTSKSQLFKARAKMRDLLKTLDRPESEEGVEAWGI